MSRTKNHTLDDYLKRLGPWIPDALLSAESLERIRRIARILPPTSGFGFESRLGDPHPAADFSVYFSELGRRQNPLAGRVPGWTARSPVWQRALQLFTAWSNPESVLHSVITSLWMELDLPAAGPVPTTPSLFLGLASGQGHREADVQWLFRDLAPMLTGKALPARIESAVRRCIEELPSGGRIFQIGFMLARRTAALRLCLEGIAAGDMVSYLLNAGWRGDAQELEEEIARLAARTDRLILALNVEDGVAGRIGIECYAGTAGWEPLLDIFSRRGLCLDGKRDALLSFPKTLVGADSAPFYPEAMAELTTRLGLWERRAVRFLLNHLKLTLGDGLFPEAKAYFGVRYLWQERRSPDRDQQGEGITKPGMM